jgi:hypothetical protein
MSGIIEAVTIIFIFIISIICFVACLALTGVSLYYLMKILGHEPLDLYDKIDLWDIMMGEPQLLGIYVSLAISVGMFSFQIVIKVAGWILQAEHEAIE